MMPANDSSQQTAYRVYRMSQFGRPVLATPILPREVRLAGLMRFQPVTRKRAIYRWIMGRLIHAGLDHWFASDQESPIDAAAEFDFHGWRAAAAARLGIPNAIATLIWPTQQQRKRVYVHFFTPDLRPAGFAKLSLNDDNDRRLRHESKVLRSLDARGLKACHVPRVLVDDEFGGHRYLVCEPIPESAVPLDRVAPVFPRQVAEELGGPIREIDANALQSVSWWDRFTARLAPEHELFRRELMSLLRGPIGVRRVHGDFGRNNIVLVEGKPWVFDWEESCDDGPAMTDEIVFWITHNYARILANPAKWVLKLHEQFIAGKSPEHRRDVMLVLAFRHALSMPTADAMIKQWARVPSMNP